MRVVLATAISCILVSSPLAVEAQPQGRLEDGRAYRTGADGFRLVDEIAELQVSNDDLRKQVATLEAELDAQEQNLKRAGATQAAASGATPSCDELVSSLSLKVARLEQSAGGSSASALPAAADGTCSFESPNNPYKQELAQALAADRKSQQEIARLSEELIARSSEIAQKERELASVADGTAAAASAPATCNYDSAENPLLAKVQMLEEALQRAETAPTSTRARLSSSKAAQATVVREADVLENVRAGLQRELAEVDSLISKRKSLHDKLKAQKGMISLQLQRLETRKGMSLDSIRRQVLRMNNPAEASRLEGAIAQIAARLRQDIQIIKRFMK